MGATNSFNVGRDGYQLTIMDSTMGQITINGITSFDVKPQMVKLKSVGVDGRIRRRAIPDGHAGTFEIDRQDPSYDRYFASREANYFAGLAPGLIVITQTIQELDGSTSQFQYTDVELYPEDSGKWAGQEKVTQRFSFEAGRKIQIQ
jgi:hypothetical protein